MSHSGSTAEASNVGDCVGVDALSAGAWLAAAADALGEALWVASAVGVADGVSLAAGEAGADVVATLGDGDGSGEGLEAGVVCGDADAVEVVAVADGAEIVLDGESDPVGIALGVGLDIAATGSAAHTACVAVSSPLPKPFVCTAAATVDTEKTIARARPLARGPCPWLCSPITVESRAGSVSGSPPHFFQVLSVTPRRRPALADRPPA